MGQPLSAPLANAFLAYHEKKWIQDCPSSFKPSFYRRYVDDTYVIFNKKEHAEQFFTYLNSKHPKIKFTKEEENERKLAFLDILLERKQNTIGTSVYRKQTYTGVGLNLLASPSPDSKQMHL